MDPAPAPACHHAQALDALTAFGLRMAAAITEVTETERRVVAAVARWLPGDAEPASLAEATQTGLAVDAAADALAKATPRLITLAQAFDRIARSIRRTIALAKRVEHGWPFPRATSDSRRAMLLRQAVRGARLAIRARSEGDEEAAERLFADLNAHLDDPAFEQDLLERPVEEMTRMLCRAIGLDPDAPKPEAGPPRKRCRTAPS